ncbi:hypothetical protein MASR2M117_06900 [Paludibacter sp.]
MNSKITAVIAVCIFSFITHAVATDVTGVSGSFSTLNSAYLNNMNLVWDINTGVNNKPVKITFTVNTEKNYDFLTIYSVDASGSSTQIFKISGLNMSSTLSTIVPSGKAKVTFTTDGSVNYSSNPLYTGISVSYEVDYSMSTVSDVLVNGYLRGNLTGGAVNIQTYFGGLQLGAQNEYFTHINTNLSKFYFNKPITIEGGEIGASSSSDLKLQTGSTTRLTILGNGNVGVGTTTPSEKLSLTGRLTISPSNASPDNGYNGNIVITKPATSGQYINLIRQGQFPWSIGTVYNSNQFAIGSGKANDANFTAPYFVIDINGRVGIGTTQPDEMLTVNGKIHAKEVIVSLNDPLADFVFKSDYRLRPLHELEQFVRTNSHLPGIHSANEVEENGLSMGEMQNLLLQKVEELTLYIITG